ncbi:MAG: hypothetical protein ACYC46_08815 [Acidobacteriaceae bacterium]
MICAFALGNSALQAHTLVRGATAENQSTVCRPHRFSGPISGSVFPKRSTTEMIADSLVQSISPLTLSHAEASLGELLSRLHTCTFLLSLRKMLV